VVQQEQELQATRGLKRDLDALQGENAKLLRENKKLRTAIAKMNEEAQIVAKSAHAITTLASINDTLAEEDDDEVLLLKRWNKLL